MKKITKENLPPLLKEIPDCPEYLYLLGELPPQDKYIYLTVVGSRKFSSYGKEVCQKLIKGLAGKNIVIVSGLAIGMDTIAHLSAIDNGLKTVAVPGSGLDEFVLYPPINKPLAKKILQSGGAIISELEPKEKAYKYSFPKRNRIMAGISMATLVIEAGEKSGTLITANLAVDYNRDVLAVTNSIFTLTGLGPNKLIKNGACLITSSNDILDALGIKREIDLFKTLDSQINLSPDEKIIYDNLKVEPLSKDELVRKTKIDVTKINTLLSLMEMKELIKENFGEIRIQR